MKTTLDLSNGYTAEIMQDLDAQSPWERGDCEPPVMVYHGRGRGAFNDHKTGLSLSDLFDRLPLALFETDEGREKVIIALSHEGHFDYAADDWTADVWRDEIRDCRPSKPESWGEAEEYFTACGGLCKLAGIPYLDAQSNGYCQGDSAQVFLAATPEWMEKTGVSLENAEAALKGTLAEYSAWAWGDVYGVASICRPDGEEIDDGSCWGFYGSYHKESGLMEFAESCVAGDLKWLAKEAAERERAACGDVLTVA